MRNESVSARSVAEELLTRTGRGLVSGDFDAFAAYFALPLIMETFEGKNRLETPDHLRLMFDKAHQFYSRNNVKELYRNCLDAHFRDPDTIESTHESRVISHGVLIERAFPAFSVIRRFGSSWKIASCSYAVGQSDALTTALMARPETATM